MKYWQLIVTSSCCHQLFVYLLDQSMHPYFKRWKWSDRRLHKHLGWTMMLVYGACKCLNIHDGVVFVALGVPKWASSEVTMSWGEMLKKSDEDDSSAVVLFLSYLECKAKVGLLITFLNQYVSFLLAWCWSMFEVVEKVMIRYIKRKPPRGRFKKNMEKMVSKGKWNSTSFSF